MTQTLKRFGFVQSKVTANTFLVVLVYVDDIKRFNLKSINHLKEILHKEFNIKDLRDIKCFIGFEIVGSKIGISMSQRKYGIDLL